MRHFIFYILFYLASATSAQALSYSGIYLFGDSLSDVGNLQQTYAGLPRQPGTPQTVPGQPYDAGGRFSNGEVYADKLARGLGYSLSPSMLGGTDYAYGGARTRYQVSGSAYLGILDQVAAFRSQPGVADANALYVLWGGANNLQDIVARKQRDTLGNPIPDLQGTIGDLVTAILGLYAEGARSILVPNLPDLALVPRIAEYGIPAQQAAHQLTLAFNAMLAESLAQLESSLNGLNLIEFDTFDAMNDIVANPAQYGLSNTTDRCYTGDDLLFSGGGAVCNDPDSYLFWDGLHPTAAVHAILGQEMLVAVVPEPGALGLLAIALMLLLAMRPGAQPLLRARQLR
jgi:phospholipase/lecithinase/hemolysin